MTSSEPLSVKKERVLRIAVVEDDELYCLYLRNVLRSRRLGFRIADIFRDGESALKPLLISKPDVVLVDLGLPGMSGAELIRQLSTKLIGTAFLVLSINEEPKHVFNALRAGAHGYCLKSATPSSLIAKIRSAGNGGAPLSRKIARLLVESVQASLKFTNKNISGLTPRETQIMALLAQGKVPKEVASEMSLSYETIRDYLKSIYLKLQVRSRTAAVIKYLQSSK